MRGSAAACGSARRTVAAERQGRRSASKKRVIPILTIVAVGLLAACPAPAATAQAQFEPARLSAGSPPAPPPPTVVASGQEWLSVSVDAGGDVSRIEPLREAPAFSEAFRRAVRGWSFAPARVEGEAVELQVLVAALFRPATLYSLPGLGQPPGGPRLGPGQLPVPVATPAPPYPPKAVGSGLVIVEVEVDRNGGVRAATVVRSRPGFDTAAVNTARRWRFRPATREGQPVRSVAYLVFGFREPVVVLGSNGDPGGTVSRAAWARCIE